MKIIYTGDWHFGRDNDSVSHNQYMLDFIDWMIDYANENGIEEIHMTGDYFDNRSKLSLQTLNFGLEGARRLSERFKGRVVVLTGNHDIYFKNRLDVASVNALERYLDVVKETRFEEIDGKKFAFIPWITDAEQYDQLINETLEDKTDYVVGHFEFRNFYMNENYIMEHGQSHKELKHVTRVMTGHYHMRQLIDNVIYIGSPFPFDFNDANDPERGLMVLDTNTNETHFEDWGKVKVLSLTYDEFLNSQDQIDEHTSFRVDLPDDATEDMVDQAREQVEAIEGSAGKINYKGSKVKELMESDVEIDEIKNIDQSIIESIRGISEPPEDVSLELLEIVYKEALESSHNED